eukprot:TRINITY_DN21413_c0_g1_i1.p1 TRINITY_DN21413_c0_g1~~TRINITY_DN21413_c0_g1_i1.p1  ORF type:complete len:103 (-),score=33.95 TRINITY_DN21413_c0_g1_i1:11-319(-)
MCIRDSRGSVHEEIDLRICGNSRINSVYNCKCRVFRCGEHFGGTTGTALAILKDNVCKSAADIRRDAIVVTHGPVSYTHLRAHETVLDLVCRLLLEKKKTII